MRGATLTQPYGYEGGFQQLVRGTPPGAGNSFSLAQKGEYVSRLISAVFTLTTDGNAANRYVTVEFQDETSSAFSVNAAAVVVTATSVQRFAGSAQRGQAEWATNADVLIPLDQAFLFPGYTLKINVASIQAGDALTAIRLLFEQFPTKRTAVPGDGG